MKAMKAIQLNGRNFNISLQYDSTKVIEINNLYDLVNDESEVANFIDDMRIYTLSELYKEARKCAEGGCLSDTECTLMVDLSEGGSISIEARFWLDGSNVPKGDLYTVVNDHPMYRECDDDDDEYNELVECFCNHHIRRKFTEGELWTFEDLPDIDRKAFDALHPED